MLNLIINCGSSSIKYSLIDLKTLKIIKETNLKNIADLKKTLKEEINKKIYAISHRVVHGGDLHQSSALINSKVKKDIAALANIAPLHNLLNLQGIELCEQIFPKIPQIAVFDTAYYSTLSEKSYTYPLPEKIRKKYKIRKYGFHGINHQYLNEQAEIILKKKNLRVISCHLGNGSSITASKNCRAIETSMGFTPLAGIIMGTRSGDIDPGIVLFLQENLKMKPEEIKKILYEKSGFYGLNKESNLYKIHQKALNDYPQAKLTLEILTYQTIKTIGAFATILNGFDALIFSGGIGENADYIREKICNELQIFGVNIDKQKNQKHGKIISIAKSKVAIMIIKAQENLQIAKESKKLLKNLFKKS